MKQYFNALGIYQWDVVLYEMGLKEKEPEVYFLSKISNSRFLPF